MSSKRFEIDIGLNASGVAKGASDGKKALADLEEAVGDVATESAKSGGKVDSFAAKLVDAARKAGKSDDDIKDALRNMGLSARQAEEAVEDIGDEFRETGRHGKRAADDLEDSLRDVQRQSERTSDEVGDVGEKGFRKLGDAGKEVSGELKQNLGETFSSFRGDLEDLPQIAQDVFGGLAGSVGTLPAAFALAAAAAGIGLLINGFEQVNEQEEERKKRVAEWAQVYIESLGQMTGAVANFAAVEKVYTDPELYAKAEENAKNWGVAVSTAVNAMAGDATALEIAQQNVADKTEKVGEKLNDVGGDIRGLNKDYRDMRAEASRGQEALDALTGEMEAGQQIANQYSDSLLQIVQSADSAGVEVDKFGNTVYTLPDGKQVMIAAATGKATEDVSAFKGDVDGKIDQLNNRDIVLDVATGQALSAVQSAVNQIDNMSATLTVRANVYQAIRTVQEAVSGWDK